MTPATKRHRLLSAAFYLGLAPLFWFRRSQIEAVPFLRHHFRQALAMFFLLACVVGLAIALFATNSILLVFQRTIFESLSADRTAVSIVALCALVWLFLSAVGFTRAVRGSTDSVWLTKRIAARRTLIGATAALGLLTYIATGGIAALAIRSTQIVESRGSSALCYMVYDDMGFVPRWVFTLGFYRISIAANEQWGAGSVAVIPLSRGNLDLALRRGCVVFVASHGRDGVIDLRDGQYGPAEAKSAPPGPHLRLVYIAACDAGLLRNEWEAALAPARVRTFERLSAVAEHVVWLWTAGPATVRTLPD
jgi:hypothetical protein